METSVYGLQTPSSKKISFEIRGELTHFSLGFLYTFILAPFHYRITDFSLIKIDFLLE